MKIRFIFNPTEMDIPNDELFDYLQDQCGFFEDLEFKDVSEQKLFDALSEIDPEELHVEWGFSFPEVISIEFAK